MFRMSPDKEYCAPTKDGAAVETEVNFLAWRVDFAFVKGWRCLLGLNVVFFQHCLNWAELTRSHSYHRRELARINVLWNKSLFCLDIRRLFSCDTALARCLSAAFGHCHCWFHFRVVGDAQRPRKCPVIALATILHWFCLRHPNVPAPVRSVLLQV